MIALYKEKITGDFKGYCKLNCTASYWYLPGSAIVAGRYFDFLSQWEV